LGGSIEHVDEPTAAYTELMSNEDLIYIQRGKISHHQELKMMTVRVLQLRL
jgi:hypothetical protein